MMKLSFEAEEEEEEDEEDAEVDRAKRNNNQVKSSLVYSDRRDSERGDSDQRRSTAEDSPSDAESMNFGSTVHLTRSTDDDLREEEEANGKCGGSGGPGGAYSWQGTCLSSLLLVVLVCAGLFLGRTYVKTVLVWLEDQNGWVSLSIFLALFTSVSFPFMWGYILLNVVAGYLYGFFWGLLITAFTVLVGTLLAHFLLRRCLVRLLASKLSFNAPLKAILMVLGGPHTFRVVAITRLTPIPFGLQNALFAMSPIGTGVYLVASVVGLFPTQAINAYLGSTLRSMEDVLTDNGTQLTGYLVFAVQVVISVGLTAYVVHKAKAMLKEVMLESSGERRLAEDDGALDDVLIGDAHSIQ